MFLTTTPKDMVGSNISYPAEKNCAESLLKVLPENWNIRFNWCQILFSDVQYEINLDEKIIEIDYNRNLIYWWSETQKEIIEIIKKDLEREKN